ncbi:GNAT family N-acetyltransferase [Deinococcus rubellus]
MALPSAPLLHDLYRATPGYFALLGCPVPSLQEVTRDIETALYDPRRRLELLYQGEELVGSLDYKLDYPQAGDVTINLLMIRGDAQSRGLGRQVVRDLEKRLPHSERLLASVLGDNKRAVKFWERLGFAFATDARPVMTWYAKPLHRQARPDQPLPVASGK